MSNKFIINVFVAVCMFFGIAAAANAIETKVIGTGSVPLSGYNVKQVRNQENAKVADDKNINKAVKQAEKRKKEDAKLASSVRQAVVTEARNKAKRAAVITLIDQTLGANASKTEEVAAKIDDLLSQLDTYVVDEEYSGEVIDGNYIAKVILTVDTTAFTKQVSDNGIAINTQKMRANSILLVMDDFFTAPIDYSADTPLEDVTTYKYDNSTKYKNSEKENASSSASASSSSGYSSGYSSGHSSGYAGYYGAGGSSGHSSGKSSGHSNAKASAKSNYGYSNFTDFTNNESEFYQHIVKYAPKNPKLQSKSATLTSLKQSFEKYDVRAINESVFKSKYFKGKPISADQLENSAELVKVVTAAKKEAHADYFGIGVAEITDYGIDDNTGRYKASGKVTMEIFSTSTNELIASGVYNEVASGVNANDARNNLSQKIGDGLGEVLAQRIFDYWKTRQMYGSEYNVIVKGNFLPAQRIAITKSIKSISGVKNVKVGSADSAQLEYTVSYNGDDEAAEAIFTGLLDSGIPAFNNYDYKIDGGNITFIPLKGQR